MYFTTHNVPFSWTPELQQELERKREAMKQPVKLSPLDLNKKMYAFWDAAVTVGVVSEIPFLCDKKDYFMRGARVVFIQLPRIWDSFPNQTWWASRTPDYSKWRKSFFSSAWRQGTSQAPRWISEGNHEEFRSNQVDLGIKVKSRRVRSLNIKDSSLDKLANLSKDDFD